MFSLYTALRWVDIKKLKWESIRGGFAMVQQSKTSKPVVIPLHPHAIILLGEHQAEGLVFDLPTQDGANKALGQWIKSAGIEKHITWHSLRHTVSVILQDKGVEIQTVAGMLGHTSTQHVSKTYKRYRNEKAAEAIKLLPV
jgi:integrase/recombinase XerD